MIYRIIFLRYDKFIRKITVPLCRFLVVKLGVEGFFGERGKSYGEKNQDCCDYAVVPFGRRDADIHECPGGGEGQGEERKGKAADL